MRDERSYIANCLDGFAIQNYPLDHLEVLVVDGGSEDGSRQYVEARASVDGWIRLIENPLQRASAAFNRGIEAAHGEVVCLFSSHGVPDRDYVSESIRVLADTGATGVGGQYRHEGLDPVSNAIGLAMVSPVGMASPHRFGRRRAEVDTISHPAYVRADLIRIGPFDESLLRNSDYELNWRLRAAGNRLVFDPSIGSVYRPRGSLVALGRQFWSYGRWKVRVIRHHPRSLKARHLVAPFAVLGAGASPLLIRNHSGRRFVSIVGIGYAAAVAMGVRLARPRAHRASPLVMAVCFPIMHACWGAGFLASLIEDALVPLAPSTKPSTKRGEP